MARLEDLTRGAAVRGILPDGLVTVVDVKWIGTVALELTYKDAAGRLANELIYRDREPTLEVATAGRPWSFDGNGGLFRLVSEAYRIGLAYLFDPLLAVHTSLVEPLPHQITAVYGEMLPRQPLRFLLADDPGSGKTIMAGLLIKELSVRGDLHKCLIICPGNLVEQWQDEMDRRFHLPFEIMTNDKLESARSGNWFTENPLAICRLDKLSRDEDVQTKLLQTDWDLVICDEAHKMSASIFGGEVKATKRYRLGQLVSGLTRHFLLMTATPHNGKEEDFQLFMALLDGDRFEGKFRDGVHVADTSDMMRRLVKEQLLKFDGKPLFPERIAYTVNYALSDGEAELYKAVTEYVREEFNRADALENEGRKGTVGFALTILQRRLASSPEAIYQSLRRRRERLEKRLREEQLLKRAASVRIDLNPTVINKARAEIARCVASRKIELGELDKATIIFGKDKGKKHKAGPLSNEGVTAYEVLLMRVRPEVVNAFLAEHAPPVLDPFCGGGSIPLEAQRLGLRAYGSDLNPVPVLITKALIEIPPKFAGKPPVNPASSAKLKGGWTGVQGLAEDVRYYGKWIRDEAEKRIGHLYPKVTITKEMAVNRPDLTPSVGEELTVIAWLWTRTVPSPDPAVGSAQVPLVRSFWLSSKKDKEAWVRPICDRKRNSYRFEVGVGRPPSGFDPKKGTVTRSGGTCILSDGPMPFDHIRAEGKAGRMSARLIAVVAEGKRGRVYLSPSPEHEKAADLPVPPDYPDTDLPKQALSMRVMLYGMDKHYKLFTPRQLTALEAFCDLVIEARTKVLADAGSAGQLPTMASTYADSITTYLAEAASKLTVFHNTLTRWRPGEGKSAPAFGRQAVPMVWDFPELNPWAGAGGDWEGIIDAVEKTLLRLPGSGQAICKQLDAVTAASTWPSVIIATDPPYYDNIGYADLSDFFYVWLRRMLSHTYPSLFSTLLTPKNQELIATPYRHGGDREQAARFFENGMGKAFVAARAIQDSEYPAIVYYAFKQNETEDDGDDEEGGSIETASTGWETMLEGMIRAGFAVSGTWPSRTEGSTRLIAMGTNALASSIVLSCRPRAVDAPLATRREFLIALKRELPEALKNLQRGSIAPVDLAQAAIGPGMAVFTRYSKVMETDGSAMSVRTALGLINQALDEVLAEQEGEFDADTRWALAWFEQCGMDDGAFGLAETLSKAKNTAVNGLVEAGVIKARSGKVRLLKRDELPDDWNPATDKRLTIWEVTQHLIRTLDQKGESGAADLVRKLGGTAEIARDLAYRLYTICERKKWADEALAYNGLVIAWPELRKLAVASPAGRTEQQPELFT